MSTITLNTAEATNKEEKRLSIDVMPSEFPGLITTMYCDTTQISKLINNFIRPIFPDEYGTRVEVQTFPNNPAKILSIMVIFTDKGSVALGEGQYKALEPIVTQDKLKSNMSTRLKYYNNMRVSNNTQNVYQFTEEAKEMLSELVPNSALDKKGNVRWNQIMTEFNLKSYNTPNLIAVGLYLDFNKVLKKIYGHKTQDKSVWNYLVMVGNPINPVMAYDGSMTAKKWQVFIMRIKDKDIYDLATRYGYDAAMGMNRMGIITD